MELDSISELNDTTNAFILDDIVRWNGRMIQILGNTFSRINHNDMSILAMSKLPENTTMKIEAGADGKRGPYVEFKIDMNLNPSNNNKSDSQSAETPSDPDTHDRDYDKDTRYG